MTRADVHKLMKRKREKSISISHWIRKSKTISLIELELCLSKHHTQRH